MVVVSGLSVLAERGNSVEWILKEQCQEMRCYPFGFLSTQSLQDIRVREEQGMTKAARLLILATVACGCGE